MLLPADAKTESKTHTRQTAPERMIQENKRSPTTEKVRFRPTHEGLGTVATGSTAPLHLGDPKAIQILGGTRETRSVSDPRCPHSDIDAIPLGRRDRIHTLTELTGGVNPVNMSVSQPKRRVAMSYIILEEDGQWSIRCAETGVATCGDTQSEAIANLKDAIELYCDTIKEIALRPWNVEVQ